MLFMERALSCNYNIGRKLRHRFTAKKKKKLNKVLSVHERKSCILASISTSHIYLTWGMDGQMTEQNRRKLTITEYTYTIYTPVYQVGALHTASFYLQANSAVVPLICNLQMRKVTGKDKFQTQVCLNPRPTIFPLKYASY